MSVQFKKTLGAVTLATVLITGITFGMKYVLKSKSVTVTSKTLKNKQISSVVLQDTNEKPEEAKQETPVENENSQQVKEALAESKENTSVQSVTRKEETKTKMGLVSWGHSSDRSAEVDTIIVHSVYNKTGGDQYSLRKILDIFKDYNVSPHYIIEREGDVHQLVKEASTAWHAGVSEMPDGRENANNFSIGIEIVNAENDEPKSAQYKSLDDLIEQIKGRHKIKYILGHSDIAQGRKTDPWNFDWKKVGGKEK